MRESVTDSRDLVHQLRTLGAVQAPATLLPAVQRAAGLWDAYFAVDTPLGPLYVAYNQHGISAAMRAESPEEFEHDFQQRLGRPAVPDPAPRLAESVRRHLAERSSRDLQFDLRGLSEFEQAVLRKVLEIPRGEIRPYGWVAREIGNPRAVRAVGSAVGRNPIPLLIPCHRVVRSDGMIGEYGLGGPANKRTLLEWEGIGTADVEAMARRGIRYIGSDTTNVYCFPTCRHARRIAPGHRLAFHSSDEAEAVGFRPCSVCRPGARTA